MTTLRSEPKWSMEFQAQAEPVQLQLPSRRRSHSSIKASSAALVVSTSARQRAAHSSALPSHSGSAGLGGPYHWLSSLTPTGSQDAESTTRSLRDFLRNMAHGASLARLWEPSSQPA